MELAPNASLTRWLKRVAHDGGDPDARALVVETLQLLATLRPREAVASLLLDRVLTHLGVDRGAVLARRPGVPLPEVVAASPGWDPPAQGVLYNAVQDVLASGKTRAGADLADAAPASPADVEDDVGLLAVVPIARGTEIAGVLCVGSTAADVALETEELWLLEGLASYAAIAFENARELQRRADHDPLTGVANHGLFWSALEREVDRAQRYGARLSVVMLDVDGFKAFNDGLGHLAGDRALADVASALARSSRASDTVARYGGEEFAVILPQTQLAGALAFARKMIAVVRERRIARRDGSFLTIAAGVAELTEVDPDARALVRRADAELYRAKRAGGDRVSPGE